MAASVAAAVSAIARKRAAKVARRLEHPHRYPYLQRHVDPILFWTAAGDLEGYARNSRGLHVPMRSLTPAELRMAPHWLDYTGQFLHGFDYLDHARDVLDSMA